MITAEKLFNLFTNQLEEQSITEADTLQELYPPCYVIYHHKNNSSRSFLWILFSPTSCWPVQSTGSKSMIPIWPFINWYLFYEFIDLSIKIFYCLKYIISIDMQYSEGHVNIYEIFRQINQQGGIDFNRPSIIFGDRKLTLRRVNIGT